MRGSWWCVAAVAFVLFGAGHGLVCDQKQTYPDCTMSILDRPKGQPKECCQLVPHPGVAGALQYQVQSPYLGKGKSGKVFLAQIARVEGADVLPDQLRDYKMVIKMPIISGGILAPMRAAEMDQEAKMILKLMVPLTDQGFPVISGLGRFRMKIEGSPSALNDFMPMELVGSDVGDESSVKGNRKLYSGPLGYFKSRSASSGGGYDKVRGDGKAMMCQLMKGLEYTGAKRVMLRDVKPDNVLARVREDDTFATQFDEEKCVPDPVKVKWADFGKAVDLDNIRTSRFTGGWMADILIAAPQRANNNLNIPEARGRVSKIVGPNYSQDPAGSPYYSFDMWHAGYVLISIATGEDQKIEQRDLDPIETVQTIARKADWDRGRRDFGSADPKKPITETQAALLKFGGWSFVDLLSGMCMEEDPKEGLFRISPVEALYHPFFFDIPDNASFRSLQGWMMSLGYQYARRLRGMGRFLRGLFLGDGGYYKHGDTAKGNGYVRRLCTEAGGQDIEASCRAYVKASTARCRPDQGAKCGRDDQCSSLQCVSGRCAPCHDAREWGCDEEGQPLGSRCLDGAQCRSGRCERGACTACKARGAREAVSAMSQALHGFCVDYHRYMCMALLPTASGDHSVPGHSQSWFSMNIPRFRRDPFRESRASCAALMEQ